MNILQTQTLITWDYPHFLLHSTRSSLFTETAASPIVTGGEDRERVSGDHPNIPRRPGLITQTSADNLMTFTWNVVISSDYNGLDDTKISLISNICEIARYYNRDM